MFSCRLFTSTSNDCACGLPFQALFSRAIDAGHLDQSDVFFIATFLMICHSIIDDALLFAIFGAKYWVIVGVRVIAAFIISFFLLYLFSTILPVQRVVKSVKL